MSDSINISSIDFGISDENQSIIKMPKLKQKIRKIGTVPHFPNVNVPMKEDDIINYKKKYPDLYDQNKIFQKNQNNSNKIELNNSLNNKKTVNNDELNNDSIVGDIYIEEDRTNNYIKGYLYHKLGNCHSFFADKNGNPLFIIGPRWYNFFLISFVVNFFIWFYLIKYKIQFSDNFIYTGIVILSIFQLSFSYSFICNPGFPKNDKGRMNGIPKEIYKYCSDCSFYIKRNIKVRHCFDCGFCIERFYYHSPWLSKCIGEKNKIIYYIYIGSILVNAIYLIICISISST